MKKFNDLPCASQADNTRVVAKKRAIRQASFPRLREIRETLLGWEVVDLVARLNNRPSMASIYRLEAGQGVRAASARRVFDVINQALGNTLDPAAELQFKEKPHE